jgi:quercetin dioxygenase-like cupin family protein
MTEVGMSQEWGKLALDHAEARTWTRVGDGFSLSVVGRDPESGATAMFQRMSKGGDLPESREHSHIVDCQSLVLSGVVEVAFGSDRRTLKAGDYLRVPAGVPHTQVLISDEAEMFVITAGNPGIEFVVPQRWSARQ